MLLKYFQNKYNNLLIIVVLIIHSIYSCDSFEPLHEKGRSSYVMNCLFNPDSSTIKLHLSKYRPFQDSIETMYYSGIITNADAAFYTDGNWIGNFTYVNDSDITRIQDLYELENILFQEGKNYSTEVKLSDNKILIASDNLPVKTPIISVDTALILAQENSNNSRIRCRIKFHDIETQINYYTISAFQVAYDDSFKVRKYIFPVTVTSEDPVIEGNLDFGFGQFCYFSDMIFNNKDVIVTCEFQFPQPFSGEINYIDIQLNSISKNYYLYAKSIDEYLKANDDFYAEPVQVYSNVENGYGIFAAYNSSTYRIYLPKNKLQ